MIARRACWTRSASADLNRPQERAQSATGGCDFPGLPDGRDLRTCSKYGRTLSNPSPDLWPGGLDFDLAPDGALRELLSAERTMSFMLTSSFSDIALIRRHTSNCRESLTQTWGFSATQPCTPLVRSAQWRLARFIAETFEASAVVSVVPRLHLSAVNKEPDKSAPAMIAIRAKKTHGKTCGPRSVSD